MIKLNNNNVLDIYGSMAKSISLYTNQEYLDALCVYISGNLQASMVLIGKIDTNRERVTTSSLAINGELRTNITYQLQHTPCEDLINASICVHKNSVKEIYEKDDILTQFAIESYVAAPLYAENGQIDGLIAILDKHPIEHDTPYLTFIDLVSTRITSEINRMRAYEDLNLQHGRFKELVKCASDIVWELDADQRITYVSDSVEQILGYVPERLIGLNILPYIRFLDDENYLDIATCAQKNCATISLLNQDNKVVFVECHFVPIYDAGGLVVGLRGLSRDVTEQINIEKRLVLADKILENVSEGIMVTDLDNRIIRVNNAFTKITGYSESEVVGRNPSLLKSGRHGDNFYKAFYQSLEQTGCWEGEIWNQKKSGVIYPQWVSISPLEESGNRLWGRVAVLSDLTQRKEFDRKIEYQATHDSLTDLSNRRNLIHILDQEILRCERSGPPFALVYIDLDNFKWVNDTWGHPVGDKLLQLMSERIRGLIRKTDLAARIGGDEFAIFLSNLKEKRLAHDIKHIADKVLAAINQPCVIDGVELIMSASLGAASYPFGGKSTSDILRNADSAMLEAKEGGKNQYHLYTSEVQSKYDRRNLVKELLASAIEDDELCIEYCPVRDIENNRTICFEPKVKWVSPELGNVSYSEFYPIAVESGLLNRMELWQINSVCKVLAQLKHQHLRQVPMLLHLSGGLLLTEGACENIASILKTNGIDPKLLILEITEETIADRKDLAKAELTALQKLGIQLSLASLGSRLTTIEIMYDLGFDLIKIPSIHIKNVEKDIKSQAIVSTVLHLTKQLNNIPIAEGVRTREQSELLATLGCRYQKGHYIGCMLEEAALRDSL